MIFTDCITHFPKVAFKMNLYTVEALLSGHPQYPETLSVARGDRLRKWFSKTAARVLRCVAWPLKRACPVNNEHWEYKKRTMVSNIDCFVFYNADKVLYTDNCCTMQYTDANSSTYCNTVQYTWNFHGCLLMGA